MSQFDRGVGTYWPTVCSDPRCTTTQTCQRERHERYGNAPGENYGPRCIPAPPSVERTYEQGIAEGERRACAAVVAWLRGEVDAAMEMHLPVRAATFLACAEAIERGEHRREEIE